VNRPKLVLCDEPTGSLDEATGRDILALLRQVNDEDAATLIIVTHEPHIANAARRRIVLRDGNIAEDEIGEAS
jgi:putative ABC transport system ATP-binding protein